MPNANRQWILKKRPPGEIEFDAHLVGGIENALSALDLLFTGGNTGKLLVQVSEEP